MLNLLIVDDEYYFRQALKVSLPWEELGYRIEGEAKNGEEALDLMSEKAPDVVLVDINMPIMDGMEFIQQAKRREPETKFIVLTGHSEFAYARQAMQLGVFNYVLKPINEEELRSSLLEVKRLIQKERNVRLELERLKMQAKEYMPVLKDRLLNGWLQDTGLTESAFAKERLEYLGIDLSSSYYTVVVIDIDSLDDLVSEEDKQIRKLAVRGIAQEYVHHAYPYAGCQDQEDRFVMIIGSADGAYANLEPLCEAIRQSVQRHLGCTVTVGVGNGYPGLERISVSYREALFALKHRFVMGGNQVIVHSAIAEAGMKISLFSVEKRSALLMCMRIGNAAETEEWLASFFRDARNKNASLDMLLVAGIEIVSTCLEFLAEASQSFEDVSQEQAVPDMLQLMQKMNTMGELENWVRTLILTVMSHVHGRKQNRAAKIVEEVKAYIRRHYGNEELRIEAIAKSVHMNYNHLCFVFKKETSVTINDYLTEYRIAKAKELFDQGAKVVQDVANRVGYADANYFGKCFKKHTGITPSKYVNDIRP
ncbi:response regulator [Cohnella caldifontis]|uniref:response regulator transcription factor n=1 Tax=Cohnella caldifontis TaxID=3027471 RepID=UPI0023EC72D7|nr:response regulator [Cohnella sp. YIM B05605]